MAGKFKFNSAMPNMSASASLISVPICLCLWLVGFTGKPCIFWNINLSVWSGFGSIICSPHDFHDVSGFWVARKVSLFWSLGAPCVRAEDLDVLTTVASVLRGYAGCSSRFLGDLVISPGSRMLSIGKISWGLFRAAGFFRWIFILGWC
jgi:hypothetical protein